MNKVALHRIYSIVLSLVMIASSISVHVDLHFCKGELQSLSFFGKAKSCHTATKVCPHHAKMVIADESKKDCCTNTTFEIDDLDTDFNITPAIELTEFQLTFVASFAYSFFPQPPSTSIVSTSVTETNDLLPPIDIYVQLERFLI